MKKSLEINNTIISVIQGDLTEQGTEAIVNAANNLLKMGGGVAGAIRKKGGLSIQKECDKIGPIEIGGAALTHAGDLKAKYVVHAATMGMDFKTDENKIRSATRNSLKIADEKNIASVAFPALGCGVGGFSLEKASKIMIEEINTYLSLTPSKLKEIRFVLFDREAYEIFKDFVEGHIEYIRRKQGHYPIPTADIIIEVNKGFILIERENPPFGWAIPGGFVNYDESLEETAVREAKEETGMKLKNLRQLHTYSKPGRDPRFHTISTVFIAEGVGKPKASSDAKNLKIFTKDNLPQDIVFDHKVIIEDYLKTK